MALSDQFINGAVDLGRIKAAAEAKAQAARNARSAIGLPTFVEITAQNFAPEVIHRSTQVPVVVLIGTAGNAESETLKADLKTLAERAGLRFIAAYVDAEATPDVASAFGTFAIPQVVALGGGQPVSSFAGPQPFDVLEEWTQALIDQVGAMLPGIPPEEYRQTDRDDNAGGAGDPRFAAAQEALRAGDCAAAQQHYKEILSADPTNQKARRGLGLSTVYVRVAGNPHDAIADAQTDPQSFTKACRAADAHIMLGELDHAFNVLLEWIPTGHKEEAKARLVELFALFDAHTPAVADARRALASRLF